MYGFFSSSVTILSEFLQQSRKLSPFSVLSDLYDRGYLMRFYQGIMHAYEIVVYMLYTCTSADVNANSTKSNILLII